MKVNGTKSKEPCSEKRGSRKEIASTHLPAEPELLGPALCAQGPVFPGETGKPNIYRATVASAPSGRSTAMYVRTFRTPTAQNVETFSMKVESHVETFRMRISTSHVETFRMRAPQKSRSAA